MEVKHVVEDSTACWNSQLCESEPQIIHCKYLTDTSSTPQHPHTTSVQQLDWELWNQMLPTVGQTFSTVSV